MEIKDTYHLVQREDLVCTFDTAVRLKELGAPQNTFRKWFVVKESVTKGSTPYRKINLSSDLGSVPYSYCEKDKVTKKERVYAAYSPEEILKVLLSGVDHQFGPLRIETLAIGYFCEFTFATEYCNTGNTICEALCNLAIWLYKEGVLKPAGGSSDN